VCNDDTELTVTYEAMFPWCLLKTDLHVAINVSGIPRTSKGNPKPDEFAYGDEYGGCLDGPAAFEIPLAASPLEARSATTALPRWGSRGPTKPGSRHQASATRRLTGSPMRQSRASWWMA
jgi:hypothetical protein